MIGRVAMFAVIAAATVGWGVYCSLIGTPASFGVSLDEALDALFPWQRDAFWAELRGWAVLSCVVVAIALVRAAAVDRRGHGRVLTTARGGCWIFAAIGGMYVWLWPRLNYGLSDRDHESVSTDPGALLVLWSILMLVVVAVWSAGSAVGSSRRWQAVSPSATPAPPL